MPRGLGLWIFILLAAFASRSFGAEAFLNRQILAAASAGETTAVREALLQGADPDARDRLGNTPLILAAGGGNLDIIKLLLGKGASINAANAYGYTPVLSAVVYCRREAASLLIKAGANIKLPNKYGSTAENFIQAQGFSSIGEYLKGETPPQARLWALELKNRSETVLLEGSPWRRKFEKLVSLRRSVEAAKYLSKAAEAGNREAALILGTLLAEKNNSREGALWLKKAAQSDDPEILYNAGMGLLYGIEAPEAEAAAEAFEKSAAADFVPAKTEYAKCLFYGNGVRKDTDNARALFNEAASAGDAEAMFYKGYIQFSEAGSPGEEGEGLTFIKKAAAKGSKEASGFLRRLNAEKIIVKLAETGIEERTEIRSYLVSMNAPFSTAALCDIYDLREVFHNAYNIFEAKLCYPGDGSVKTTFRMSSQADPDETAYLKNIAPAAFFAAEGL